MTSLKKRLAGGERLIGALLRMPNEETVEMLAVAGMDFILLDCEHGPADVQVLRQHIAAALMYQVPVLVRVGAEEPGLVLRALDQGAEGIVAPHTDSVELARALVDSVHYPPLGNRGFATYSRAGRFGSVPADEHKARFLENTLVVGMIEAPEPAAHSAEILAVEGIDAVMIGVADLAAASGPSDPSPAESTAAVHRACAETGTWRMDIVGSIAAAGQAYADGAQLVVYNLAALQLGLFQQAAGVERR
ncbi:2-dehydro-3-deoxyglucarate aldolase [Naumannella sp. ID2617S]|nr:2-dehydro-3-deoxyglucarate aldolase [Naumannella sp. ID2617S]